MDLESFRASLALARPPAGLSASLRALWTDAKGDWDGAHALVMDEEGPAPAWVHAYLHRKEGDLENAAYWYERAGREKPTCASAVEWAAIVRELLA